MKTRYMLVIALSVLASLFIMPSPAEARPARVPWNGVTVEIVSDLPASWDVRGAVADIDWYTGSAMTFVKYCSGKRKCVDISKGKVTGPEVGWAGTCRSSSLICHITIDVNKASHRKEFGPATRRWLVRHELGHSRGLHDRKVCDTTMDPYVRCNGHVPPNTFTKSERSTLRKW